VNTEIIFTIGSATFDIFVKPDYQGIMTFVRPDKEEHWLCLPHGGKVKINDVVETCGGGATNTAIAFSRMGFDSCFVGKIGADYGDRVIDNLQKEGVQTHCTHKTKQDKTGFSTIINTLDGDRTVLGYPGANRLFKASDLSPEKLKKADWIFLNHISGDSNGVLNTIVQLLRKNPDIKIAWNPGHEQLMAGAKKWRKLLKYVNLLFINKEEATLFTKKSYRMARIRQDARECHVHRTRAFLPPYADDVSEIMQEIFKYTTGIVVITDGRNGAQASDGKKHYFCPVLTQKRVDTLGAGDAFASGFTAAVIRGKNLKTALIYGTLNAHSVVSYYGAQEGLLTKGQIESKFKSSKLCVSEKKLR
jgi:ribokinase